MTGHSNSAELAAEIIRSTTPPGLPVGIQPIGRQRGVITAVAPGPPTTVSLTLGGSAVPISGIRCIDGYAPTVGNTVVIDGSAGDLLVMGSQMGTASLIAGWTVATRLNSWIAFGGAYAAMRYRRDAAGVVWIDGAVKGGAAGSTIFTLPAGFRPGATQAPHFASGQGPQAGNITTAGAVVPPNAAGVAFVGLFYAFLAEN